MLSQFGTKIFIYINIYSIYTKNVCNISKNKYNVNVCTVYMKTYYFYQSISQYNIIIFNFLYYVTIFKYYQSYLSSYTYTKT